MENSTLQQRNLFPELDPAEMEVDAPSIEPIQNRRTTRPRTFDEAYLRCVGFFSAMTVHQLVYRFRLYKGLGWRYGNRIVNDLVTSGYLTRSALRAGAGAASVRVVELTPAGFERIGQRPRPEPRRQNPEIIRDYRIQFAEMMMERQLEGWKLVPQTQAFPHLKAWALAHFRGRALNSSEQQDRYHIERTPEFRLNFWLLAHPQEGIRIILPVRKNRSFKSTIAEMDVIPILFPRLHVEVVSADPELQEAAEGYLRRWARKRQARASGSEGDGAVAIHSVPHFLTRPSPRQWSGPRVDLYARNGVPEPERLI